MQEIADFLDTRYATIQRIISTEYLDTTSLVMLVRIAEYLDIKVDDMFKYEGLLENKEGKEMLEIDKYLQNGEELRKLYIKKKDWTDKEFKVQTKVPIMNLQRALHNEKRQDFFHEAILLYSEVSGNMNTIGDLLTDEDWIENATAWIAGFYGTR